MRIEQTAARRRRGRSLEEALLAAAWDELSKVGYQALTMDAVAARANTSKAVLYRRWSSRAELVLAAVRIHAPAPLHAPDADNLRDDLKGIVRWLSDRYREFPEVVRGLIIELPEASASIVQTSVAKISFAYERAMARQEISASSVTTRLLRLPLDLATYEMFVTRSALSETQIDEIVDGVVLPLIAPKATRQTTAHLVRKVSSQHDNRKKRRIDSQ